MIELVFIIFGYFWCRDLDILFQNINHERHWTFTNGFWLESQYEKETERRWNNTASDFLCTLLLIIMMISGCLMSDLYMYSMFISIVLNYTRCYMQKSFLILAFICYISNYIYPSSFSLSYVVCICHFSFLFSSLILILQTN